MALDPDLFLSHPPIETRQRITPKKVILYALGVGATELPFVYEDGLKALPGMAVIMAYPGFIWRDPKFGVDWKKILHGETSIVCHAPLPTSGELIGSSVFGPIIDKGAAKGAVVYQTREIHHESGTHVATVRNATFLRGDGGFGGSPDGQPAPHAIPDRAADLVHSLPTAENQALIYRLSGDMNPLHVDPAVAQAAGFPRPILHGLCTFGIAGRALLAALGDNRPERIRRIDARFSAPVFPGETIVTEIWREGDGSAAFRCKVAERDLVVLNNGYVEFQ
ncbi:MAG: MaoC/PaaZ C-terminal domain-containing protein [Rhizorhabdus sp.]